MTERAETALKILAARIAADGIVSEDEALSLRAEIFPDGVVTRAEAEALLRLNDCVRRDADAWRAVFVEALCDHMIMGEDLEGHLSEPRTRWLEQALMADGRIDRDAEVALLAKLLERAASAPVGFHGFVRDRIFQLLTAPPPVDLGAREVDLIRRVLFAEGGSKSIAVSRDEAEWLFAIDAAADGGAHHESWRDLFVKAICNHLMCDAAPALLDRNRLLHRASIAARPAAREGWSLHDLAKGGLKGFLDQVGQRDPIEGMERNYSTRTAQMAAAERLTLSEIAWVTARARADARLTGNERAVLEELRRIEREQAAEPAL
jgi:hypothetical protein